MGKGITPQKRLGQHFLRSADLARRIVGALEIDEGDTVLEIGPGEGILTEALLESRAGRVVTIELDERCCRILEDRFGQDDRLSIINKDILKIDPCEWAEGNELIRVVGNLPYYITSPILFHILDRRDCIRDIVVMVQKEVGDRIVSLPGTKVYGIPSVLFQAFSKAERLFHVSRDQFRPIPEVDSTVIKLTFYKEPPYAIEDVAYFQKVVRTAFGQRRKMLKNTLKSLVKDEEILQSLPVDLSKRPEALSVAGFVQLSNAVLSIS